MPTHDATNSFKLYDAQMVRELRVESVAGFELGLELTVKAFLNGYRIAEIPSVWRDRTAGDFTLPRDALDAALPEVVFPRVSTKVEAGAGTGAGIQADERTALNTRGLSPLKGLSSF